MRFVPDAEFGPFDSDEGLTGAFREAGHVLSSLERVEELFRYDETHISIVKTARGDLYLEAVVDSHSERGDDGITQARTIVHLIPFTDENALRSTLNTDFAPTMTTYEAACGPITRMVLSSEGGKSRLSIRSMPVEDVAENELPDRHMKPGRISLHGPFSDPYSIDSTRQMGFSILPSHEEGDEVVVYHGCDRSWIVRRPRHVDSIVFVACVADDPTGWVQHRFSFDRESDLLETLAAGAPTLETYERARWIDREVVSTGHAAGTWVTVERIGTADLQREDIACEAPTYATRADHDAEWPAFAGGSETDQ